MFSKKAKTKSDLDKAIDEVFKEMKVLTADSDEYAKMVDQLQKLYSIRADEKHERIRPETLITVAGNLAGIGMIILFERNNVVTSKALSFVLKPKA